MKHQEENVSTTPGVSVEARDFARTIIFFGPPNLTGKTFHPMETLLREAPDFQQEAELADALLHPQDRAYSVPQLFEFIERAGLTFGRWVKQAPYSPHCGIIAKLPQASWLAQLPPAEQYAAAELFRGTMLRHSVVLYQKNNGLQPINFSGDNWTGYVPIRNADTICIQERLPAGAAAVHANGLNRKALV